MSKNLKAYLLLPLLLLAQFTLASLSGSEQVHYSDATNDLGSSYSIQPISHQAQSTLSSTEPVGSLIEYLEDKFEEDKEETESIIRHLYSISDSKCISGCAELLVSIQKSRTRSYRENLNEREQVRISVLLQVFRL